MLSTGYTWEEDQATAYSWGDIGTGGEYKHYGGSDAASGDQADHLLSDVMVMQASACKSAVADPQQIDAWFRETELWLVDCRLPLVAPASPLDHGPRQDS